MPENIIVRTIKPSSDEVQDGGYGLTRNDYLRVVATIPTISKAIPIRVYAQEFRYKTRSFEGSPGRQHPRVCGSHPTETRSREVPL